MMMFWIAAAQGASAPVVDRIAAVVNDEVVALSDVYELGRDFVVQRCPEAATAVPEPAPAPELPEVPAGDTPPTSDPADPAAPAAPEVDTVPAPAPAEPTLGGEPGAPVVPGTIPPETNDPAAAPGDPSVTPVDPIVPTPDPSADPASAPAPVDPAAPPVETAEAAPAPVEPAPPAVPGVEQCVAEAELEILDALIRRVLIRQELVRLEVDVTAADVDQAIDRTVRQYQLADRQALKAEVEASGKRWDQYRDELLEFLRTQAFQGRVLAPRVTVTDDEVNDLYQRTARKVTKPVVKVSGLGIGIPPESTPEQAAMIQAQAEELVISLNAGEIPFEDAVRLYDVGATGMFTDRDFAPGDIVEPLSSALFSGPIGSFQAPVRMETPNGATVLFLLRVDEKTEKSEVAPFEEVKDQIKDQVFAEKLVDAEEEWYQRARREAAVDVKLKAQ